MDNKILFLCNFVLLFFNLHPSPTFAYSGLDCDFEQNTCGWKDYDGNSWFRANYTSGIDPGHDHTYGSVDPTRKRGSWLATIRKLSDVEDFILISSKQFSTSGPTCISFWYHFFGLKKSEFKVSVNGQNQPSGAEPLWMKQTPVSNNWIHAFVHVPRQISSFYLIFEARLATEHDTVGLDDIVYSNQPCPKTLDCDFESPHCEWVLSRNRIVNGSNINDHTTGTSIGHFVMSSGSSQMSTLTANEKNVSFTDHTTTGYYNCLKFWYNVQYSYGIQDSQSYIEFNYTGSSYYYKKLMVKDIIADDIASRWNQFSMSYPNHNNSANLIISLYTEMDTKIAIDDISVHNNYCPSIGSCDFESDFCGWTNLYSNGLWYRNTGGSHSGFKEAPPFDTTTGTDSGWYAMVPAEYLSTMPTARMQSPPLYGYSTFQCFSMNYFAVGKDTKTPAIVVLFIDLTKHRQIDRVLLNTSTTNGWNRFRYRIEKLPYRFAVQIETAYEGRNLKSDIAIDDIKFDSNCHAAVTTPTPPIPYPERKWNCNFEYGCSAWSIDSSWKVYSYRTAPASLNVPRRDHTLKTSNGHYLLWDPSNIDPNANKTISYINSTVLSNDTHCLSFWYYDSSEIPYELDLNIVTRSYPYGQISIRPNIISLTWKLVKLELYKFYNTEEYVQFRFITSGNSVGTFALDDIQITPGKCKRMDDFVYTFNSFDDLELSHIYPLNGNVGILYRSYYSSRYPYAPKNDHTTGTGPYFLFMDSKNDANTTYKDQLTIDDLPEMSYAREPSSRCVKFAYQAYGNATFMVGIAPEDSTTLRTQFKAYADHRNWVVSQFSYFAPYQHKVIFQMIKNYDLHSYIAIDDISISQSSCKEAVECDFDDDICSFSSTFSYKTDYEFARFIGPPDNASWPGPGFDHTKRGYGGGYLYMTGYPSQKRFTRYSSIQTPIKMQQYSTFSNYCISMWTQINQPDGILNVQLGLSGTNKDRSAQKQIQLFNLQKLNETKWTPHFIEIDKKLINEYYEFYLIFTGITQNTNTVIAIDDIELMTYSCNFKTKFTCQNKQVISMDKVCDFYKDCSDGSDEDNCGNCDFEKDKCGWYNQSSTTSGTRPTGFWVPVDTKNGQGPKVDGSNNANGHYLLLNNSASTFYPEATLIRNERSYQTQFKHSYLTCTMTFDYFINNNEKWSYAEIRVLVGNTEDSAVLKGYFKEKSSNWQKAIVYVGGFTESFVVNIFARQYNSNETVAIDNIQFHNCSIPEPLDKGKNCPVDTQVLCETTRICIDPSDLCDFEDNCGDNLDESFAMCSPFLGLNVPPSCAFEKSFDYCGFSVDQPKYDYNTLSWRMQQSSSYILMSYFGPGADHTTKDLDGQYALLHSYNHKLLNQSAMLYSPMMVSTGDICIMRFFYYNNGVLNGSANTLKVYVRFADESIENSEPLFISNQYMANWVKAKVHYQSSNPFQFVFDGSLANTEASISIDDVSFSGECAPSDAKRGGSSKSKSAATAVILVLLAVVVAGVVGYYIYQKKQGNTPFAFVSEGISKILSRGNDANSIIVNENYNGD